MFLSRTGLKKMMLRAFKGNGLYIRNDGKGYSIGGSNWAVYFFKGDIPKETLGDIISLVGELPDDEEAYVADKNGNQMKIYEEGAMTAMDVATSTKREMQKTPVLIEHHPYFVRVYQNKETGQATLVNEKHVAALEPGLIDSKNGETLPEGPFEGGGMVEEMFWNALCWYNNKMAFAISRLNLGECFAVDITRMIEHHQLWKDEDPDGGKS